MNNPGGSNRSDSISLEEELRAIVGAGSIENVTRLSGGASRETWSFLADGCPLILQRQRPGDVRDMLIEARVLETAFEAGVRVPKLITSGEMSSGAKFMVSAHVPGETIARKILRDERFSAARPALIGQMAESLARLHAIDASYLSGLPAFDKLEQYRTTLDNLNDSLGQSHPAFELAFAWLERNRPASQRRSLVHGDFRLGNVMVDESGLAAVLDWELAHVGDPMEDLGWLCVRAWRFGSSLPVAGLGRYDELVAAYQEASGIEISEADVLWWEVLGTLKWGIMCMIQTSSHLLGFHRSHEMAAIGRRVCENEYDLFLLLDGRWTSESKPTSPASWNHPVVVDDEQPTVHDVPSTTQLVESVREWMERDVMTGTIGRLQFHTRVAVNVLSIVERELKSGRGHSRRHLERLETLGVAHDRELADAIRSGRLDDRIDDVAQVVRDSVVDKVAVANPSYLITEPDKN
ncbi:MAG: phosphotransferase family protein [Actinomycetota bacterium]